MLGEAAHVELIDQGAGHWAAQRYVVFPIVAAQVHNRALHGALAVVPWQHGRFARIFLPLHHGSAIWVQQQFGAIEAQTLRGIIGTVSSEAVELTRLNTGNEHVPIIESLVATRIELDHASRLGLIGIVEEEQFHRPGAFREQAEVHAPGPKRRPQRIALPRRKMLSHRLSNSS